ncbi:MAG: hypothetical protein ACRENE_08085 [Polyangiaceae bacterium]
MHPTFRPAIATVVVPAILMTLCAACGGGDPQKPAASAADTSSLEREHESDGPSSGSPSAASSGSSASSGASDDSSPKSAASSSKPSAAGAGDSASTAAAAPASSIHPTPSATGSIDGKPFSPKIGRATAAMQKDGRLLVTLTEGTDCGGSPKPGEGTLAMLLEWKDGYKTDVGSLKRGAKGEVSFSRGGAVSKSFKPTGRVTVVSAPTDASATGKIKLDVQSGEFMVSGDVDVLLCVAAK